MAKRNALPLSASMSTSTAVILGVGAVLAFMIGTRLGEGRSVAVTAIGLFLVAAAFGAANFPFLGLAGVTIVTVGNLSDVLIRFWGAPPINLFLIPGLSFIVGYRWFAHGERPFLHVGVMTAIGVFLVMMLVSSLYAYNFHISLREIDDVFRNMIVVVVMLCFFSMKNSVKIFIDSIIYLIIFSSAIAIYKYGIAGDIDNQYWGFARTAHGGPRLAGTKADPNAYASILVLMLPFALDRTLWERNGWRRLLGVAALAGILVSILLTHSRGGFLATIVCVFLYGLTLERRHAIRYFGVGALVGIGILGLLSEELIARFSTITEVAETGEAPDRSVAGRLSAWAVALQLFYDHPFFGVGVGNFNVLYQTTANDLGVMFGGRDLSPHGLFLEVLSEFGAVGLTIYLGILACAASGVLRAMALLRAHGEVRARMTCAAFGVALASHLTALVFLHGPGDRLLWTFIAIAIAMPAIVRHRLDGRSHGPEQPAGSPLPL